jgi:ubiquinone/menaquinone biosynthesis C-methylase UbiE
MIVSIHKKNYFPNTERASDYDRTRPSFHKEAMVSYHQSNPLKIYDLVLDVGCGTGRSAIALTDWAKIVEAIDSSEAMLKMASPHSVIHYQKARRNSVNRCPLQISG